SQLLFCHLSDTPFLSGVPFFSWLFLLGFAGNQPRSTRFSCSFNSRMLHRQLHPRTPRTAETVTFPTWVLAARAAIPAARKAGQQPAEKWYSALITMG